MQNLHHTTELYTNNEKQLREKHVNNQYQYIILPNEGLVKVVAYVIQVILDFLKFFTVNIFILQDFLFVRFMKQMKGTTSNLQYFSRYY